MPFILLQGTCGALATRFNSLIEVLNEEQRGNPAIPQENYNLKAETSPGFFFSLYSYLSIGIGLTVIATVIYFAYTIFLVPLMVSSCKLHVFDFKAPPAVA